MQVRAIRGATTVARNTEDEILEGTRELIREVVAENGICKDDIISILFSVTSDLDAAFPAKAARAEGMDDIALMCTNEVPVAGSLRKCIRLMMHINTGKTNGEIKHIYLNGAKILRPDLVQQRGIQDAVPYDEKCSTTDFDKPGDAPAGEKIRIAIDGPAGAGKSTTARKVARQLGIPYLDTGAMYRAAALKATNEKISYYDPEALERMLSATDISVSFDEKGEQRLFLDGKDAGDSIRTPQITKAASDIASIPAVRRIMVEMQRKIASRGSIVMDGRDIGTHVMPDADLKIFLTASEEERANRRYLELAAKKQTADKEVIKKDIGIRDRQDTERAAAPLRKAEDAIVIDSTNMTPEEVVQAIISNLDLHKDRRKCL